MEEGEQGQEEEGGLEEGKWVDLLSSIGSECRKRKARKGTQDGKGGVSCIRGLSTHLIPVSEDDLLQARP